MIKNLYWYLNTFVFKKDIKLVILTVIIGMIAAIFSSLGIGLLIPVVSTLIAENENYSLFNELSNRILFFLKLDFNLFNAIIIASLVIFLGETLAYIGAVLGAYLNKNALKISRSLIVDKFINQNYLDILKFKSGIINATINEQISLAAESVEAFFRFIIQVLISGVLIITLSIISLKLTLLSVFIGFFILVSQNKIYELFRKYWKEWQDHKVESTDFYGNIINSIKFIKQSGFENITKEELNSKTLKESKIVFNAWVFKYLSPYYTKSMATWVVALLIILGYSYFDNSGAQIIIFLMVVRKIQASVNQINLAFIDLNKLESSINIVRVFFLNFEYHKKISDTNLDKKFIFDNSILYKNINLEIANHKILSNICIEIKKNSFVSIVGGSGSGKTSIVNILTRLIKPTSGEVVIDEQNIFKMIKKEFYSNVAVAAQDGFLFHDNIEKNIIYGLPLDSVKLNNVSIISECFDFINSFENQYETVVGDRGAKLSGGQIQRILLARALYKEPQILILDEATSALDQKLEKKIIQNLNLKNNNITIINIAHRLSSIIDSDVIYFLNDGKILNKGNHNELFNNSLEYKKLFKEKND